MLVARQEDDLHARVEIRQDLDRLSRSFDIKIDQYIIDHDRQRFLVFAIMLNERQTNRQIKLLARSGTQLSGLFSLDRLVHNQQRSCFIQFSFNGHVPSQCHLFEQPLYVGQDGRLMVTLELVEGLL